MASIVSNAAVASLGRILNVALGVGITAFITRLLGTDSYGLYSLLVAYGVLVQTVADLGLYLTLTREIAKDPAREQSLVTQIVSLRLVVVGSALLVSWLIAASVPALRLHLPYLVLLSIGLLMQSISQLYMGIFQQHGVVWRATVGDTIARCVQLGIVAAVMVWGVQADLPASILLGLTIAAFTLSALAAFVVHHAMLPITYVLRPVWAGPAWAGILRLSWPLGALAVLNVIYFRVDILVLSWFRPASEVGWYGLAYRIIESSLFFPAMFGGLLLPRLSEALARRSSASAQRLLQQSIEAMSAAGLLILIGTFFVAEPVVVFLSGNSFVPAAPLLQILGVALFVMFLGNIFGYTLVALEQQKALLKLYAVLAVTNLAANVWLVSLYGAAAAAWTTVATEAVAMISAGLIVRQHIHFHVSAGFGLRLAAAGAVTAAIFQGTAGLLAGSLVGQIMLILVSYLAAARLLNVISVRRFTDLFATIRPSRQEQS